MSNHFYFLLCILLFSQLANATTGCVSNSNPTKIYTTYSAPNYRHNGTIVNLNAGCQWDYMEPATPCTISGPVGAGLLALDSPQLCPIDDYMGLMLVILTGIGYLFIRKRTIQAYV